MGLVPLRGATLIQNNTQNAELHYHIHRFDWQEAMRAYSERLLLPTSPTGRNCVTHCQDVLLQFLMHLYYTIPIAPKHRTNFICLYPNRVGAYFKWKTPMQNEWTTSAAQLKPCLKNSLVWRQELSCEDELLNVLQNTPKWQHIHIFSLKWANFIIHQQKQKEVPLCQLISLFISPSFSLSLSHTSCLLPNWEFLRFMVGSDELLAQQFLRGFHIPPICFSHYWCFT